MKTAIQNPSMPHPFASYVHALCVLLVLAILGGCDAFQIDDESDPNGPSVDGVLDDPTRDQLINLAVGVESGMRTDINLYLTDVGVIGREYYRFSGSDPRFTSELLGESAAVLNNNTFYITRPWAERYRVIRNAGIFRQALEVATVPAVITEEERSASFGFIQTITAHQLLMNLNLTFRNGIRLEVASEETLGSLVSYEESLGAIRDSLDAGLANLQNGSDAFPFTLSDGFDGFGAPATFIAFNRALAARVALYRGDDAGALAALDDSFISADTSALEVGTYHVFSTTSGDLINPFFIDPQETGDLIAAHPSYIADIEEGDERASKVVERDEPFSQTGLFSNFGFFVYKSPLDPISIIRNAELLLIRAEANLNLGNLTEAVADLNIIRLGAGLDPYSGAVTEADVRDELLRQRRYELYGEGHRWVDVRRILGDDCGNSVDDPCLEDDLPIDRTGDNVWLQFPIPANEGNNL